MEDSFYDFPVNPDIYWLITGDDGHEDFIRPNEVADFLVSRFDDCDMVTAELVHSED